MGEVVENGGMRAELNPDWHPEALKAGSERREYRVTAEAGLFKNGEQINRGGTVELDEHTAGNFLATGDIEEV